MERKIYKNRDIENYETTETEMGENVRLTDESSNTLIWFGIKLSEKMGVDFDTQFIRLYGVNGTNIIYKGKQWSESKECASIQYMDECISLTFTEVSEDTIELYFIEVLNEQCKGVGTNMINTILDVSDELGLNVKVIPSPFRTNNKFGDMIKEMENINLIRKELKNVDTTYERLKGWYRSFGFKNKSILQPYTLYYTPNSK